MTKDPNSRSRSCTFPPFPAEIFKGYAREFVELYRPIREVPAHFLGMPYWTLIGNAISPYVRFSGCQPRLYTVTVAPSASKKSAGNDIGQDFFAEALAERQDVVGFGSAEGLLGALEKKPKTPTVIFLDEFATLAKKTAIQGSAGIDPLNKLFERNDYDHQLSKRHISVKDAYLSILGATTPETFQEAWTGQHEDAGFFSRLFIAASDTPPRQHSVLDDADPARRQALIERTRELVDKLKAESAEGTKPIELRFDPAARESWDGFYQSFGQDAEWRRIDTIGWRLLTIQTILKQERSISRETVREVVSVLEYEVAIRRLVQPIVADNAWAKMEEKIRRFLPTDGGWISDRDLQSKTNASRTGIKAYKWAVDNLLDNGEMEGRPGPRGGRECRRKVDAGGEPEPDEGSGIGPVSQPCAVNHMTSPDVLDSNMVESAA